MFTIIVSVCSGIASIVAILMMVTKVFGNLKKMREGQLCLLRQQILQVYNTGKAKKTIDRYERTSLDYLFEAYKSEGGNSFVQDIYKAMREWEVTE